MPAKFRVVISSLTSKGQIRMYFREFTNILSAEECVNRFLLKSTTRWIRVIESYSTGVWEEVAFLDCKIPCGKFDWPLPF